MSGVARGTVAGLLLLAATACGGSQLAWYGRTPDRARRVEVRQQGDQQWLVLNGQQSHRYHFIAADDLAFDADGRRVAFAAQLSAHPERWSVIADFVEGPAWEGVAGLRFGPGGSHFLYEASDGHTWRVVVDGAPQPAFDAVDAVTFSPGGRRIGYVAQDGSCARAVVDGSPGPCAACVVGLALADDPRRDVRIVADDADGTDAHVFVGAERVLDLPRATELDVDPAVARWAAVVASPDGARLVVDGQAQEPFERIEHVVWSSDGRSVAYAALRDRAWHVVTGGHVGAPHAEVEEPVFAARGAHVGYVGRDSDWSVVAVDDRIVWQAASPATALTLSEDGTRAAWIYRDRDEAVIAVDGDRYPFEVVVERTLRFSHDGRHWAALVGSLSERKLFVAVDGRVRLPFDTEELFGSPTPAVATRLGAWVSAELELYLGRRGARGS